MMLKRWHLKLCFRYCFGAGVLSVDTHNDYGSQGDIIRTEGRSSTGSAEVSEDYDDSGKMAYESKLHCHGQQYDNLF